MLWVWKTISSNVEHGIIITNGRKHIIRLQFELICACTWDLGLDPNRQKQPPLRLSFDQHLSINHFLQNLIPKCLMNWREILINSSNCSTASSWKMVPFWRTSTKSVMMLFFAQVRSVESINDDENNNDDDNQGWSYLQEWRDWEWQSVFVNNYLNIPLSCSWSIGDGIQSMPWQRHLQQQKEVALTPPLSISCEWWWWLSMMMNSYAFRSSQSDSA